MKYPFEKKGWRLYDIREKKFFISGDVFFYENTFPCAIGSLNNMAENNSWGQFPPGHLLPTTTIEKGSWKRKLELGPICQPKGPADCYIKVGSATCWKTSRHLAGRCKWTAQTKEWAFPQWPKATPLQPQDSSDGLDFDCSFPGHDTNNSEPTATLLDQNLGQPYLQVVHENLNENLRRSSWEKRISTTFAVGFGIPHIPFFFTSPTFNGLPGKSLYLLTNYVTWDKFFDLHKHCLASTITGSEPIEYSEVVINSK